MRALLATVVATLLVVGIATAKTELRFASGSCEGSTWQWWNVQRFENGRLVETWGVDCNGREYHTLGRAVPIGGPLGGTPTENGTCDVGTWYAVTTRVNGAQVDCWGQDCENQYWRFEPDAPSISALDETPFGPIQYFREVLTPFELVPMRTEEVEHKANPEQNIPGIDIR